MNQRQRIAFHPIESNPNRRLQFPYTITYADKRYNRRTEGSTFAIHITPLPELDVSPLQQLLPVQLAQPRPDALAGLGEHDAAKRLGDVLAARHPAEAGVADQRDHVRVRPS